MTIFGYYSLVDFDDSPETLTQFRNVVVPLSLSLSGFQKGTAKKYGAKYDHVPLMAHSGNEAEVFH